MRIIFYGCRLNLFCSLHEVLSINLLKILSGTPRRIFEIGVTYRILAEVDWVNN